MNPLRQYNVFKKNIIYKFIETLVYYFGLKLEPEKTIL